MRLLCLVALLLAVAAPSALATTQPDLIVGVDVSLKPNAVTLSAKKVQRGYYVQFRVRNTTSSKRLFTLAGRTIAIPARKYRFLVISFDVRGTYHYTSRKPAGTPIRGIFSVS
jgi:hypothetical protein